MPPPRKKADPADQARILADLRNDREAREKSYRAQALRLFPHLCARCTREFSGKRLRELTVHHKDHNHQNNPPDGSNWELLCLYCHDHEHEKYRMAGHGGGGIAEEPRAPGVFQPFAGLDSLFTKKTEPDSTNKK
jgi:hypothetical protein